MSERRLGAGSLFALGINGIVGVGIFFLPSEIAREAPGRLSVLVLVATAIGLAPVAIVFAKLGHAFDEDGGPVVYARAAFGERVAFVVGWLAFASAAFSTAATISGLSRAVLGQAHLTGAALERGSAAILLTSLAGVAALGIVVSARVWTSLTVLKLIPLAVLVAAWVVSHPHDRGATDVGAGSLLRAALAATFAYQGFEIVPVVAGQTRSSRRVVPFAVLAALGTSAFLYVCLQLACVASLPNLAQEPAPLAAAAEALSGDAMGELVRAGTSISALGIGFGMVVMTPRYLSALARVSGLRGRLQDSSATGVPQRALVATFALALPLVTMESLGELFRLASLAVVIQYALAAASLAALALRRERGLRARDAWPAVPALAVAALLVGSATATEWLVAGGTLAVGLALRTVGRLDRATDVPPEPNQNGTE